MTNKDYKMLRSIYLRELVAEHKDDSDGNIVTHDMVKRMETAFNEGKGGLYLKEYVKRSGEPVLTAAETTAFIRACIIFDAIKYFVKTYSITGYAAEAVAMDIESASHTSPDGDWHATHIAEIDDMGHLLHCLPLDRIA